MVRSSPVEADKQASSTHMSKMERKDRHVTQDKPRGVTGGLEDTFQIRPECRCGIHFWYFITKT